MVVFLTSKASFIFPLPTGKPGHYHSIFRGKEAEKVYTTGRGIGLYISKNIIEAHSGKIWAESEGKNQGANFFVELSVV